MTSHASNTFAYALWAERLVCEGWTPHLLTFMFRNIGGPPHNVARQMEREVERVYATLLTRIVRNPTRPSMTGKLPIWFCAHDRPVFKRAKQRLHDVVVNEGRHVHTVVFLPPWSRLSEDLAAHLAAYDHLYVRSELPLVRIDAVPITRRVGYVVSYARKQAGRSPIGEETDFVLPRSVSELRDRAA